MAENELIVTAGLNFQASESLILAQLKKIQDDFNSNGGLQINCTVNNDSLKVIQGQLSKLSQGITFNVGNTNLDGLNNSIRQTSDTVNSTNQRVQQLVNSLADLDAKYSNPLKAVIDTEGFVKAEETMRKLKAQLSDLGEVSVQGFYGDTNGVNKLEKIIATVKSAYGELRTLTFELGDNDLFRFVSGKFDNDGIRKQTEEINKFVDQYTSKLNSLKAKVGENFAPNISATIGEDINKTIVTFDSFEKKLAELKSGKGSVEELRAEFVALDGTVSNLGSLLRGGDSSLNQFTNATIKARNFANDLKALEVEFENLSAVTKGDKLFSSLAEAEQKLVALQNIQKNEGYTENWIKQYQELSVAIKQATEDVKLAKKLEQQDASSATKKQADALREVASAYKEINQYTKTLYSTSATDVEKGLAGAHRGDQYALIEQIKQRLESEGLLDDVLKQEIQNYEAIAKEIELIAKSRRDATQAHREEVEAEKAEKQNLQDVNRLINENIKSLEEFNNSTVAKNNASNPAVASQTGLNADLINQLRGLQESLANDRSPENVARIIARMNELDGSLKDATARSAELNQSLKDDDASAKFSAKLNNLKNQVDIFANTNRRATESLKQMRNGMTFADEWQRIVSQLKSGNLDENAIRRLTEDLRNFKGEAQSAGLTVNRFFQSMGSQLKMIMQRWVSLYAIIGRITSAFNELKSVDKILTEIAKSSDVTRESLESLGNAAFDAANKYGRSVTDYLYGVQEFSRAGFRGDQLTGLTEVSLLAQSAGDIETDLANSYVIATNAAYGLAGSQEKLGEVLDRQNYVTNNYALNMTDLASATKIAASQAAQSGIEIDQMTAALATMISTTQQGGEIAARSLRGILMNIQQVKGEVGDGEEDITAESLTKYEKAAKDLGVALKEVKNGASVLRDPMAVLNDLAEAFNKEADDSIKKANLINAIGGKYRGERLPQCTAMCI